MFVFFQEKISSWKRLIRQIKTQTWQCGWFFAKVRHFSSHRPKNKCRPLFLHKKRTFPQQIHLDAVMHFSRICRNFSTKHNELPLKLRKRFCKWFFPAKKNSARSPSGSVDSSSDNRADIFCQKFIVLSFLKGSAHFLRENTKLLTFFQKRNNLLEKAPLDRKNAFLQSVGDSSPKYDNSPPKSWKKRRNFLFFQKKRKVPQNIHLGTETPFWLSPQKTTKKTKFPLKVWTELFIGLFSGEHVFPQEVPTDAKSRVLTTLLIILCQISIFSSKI